MWFANVEMMLLLRTTWEAFRFQHLAKSANVKWLKLCSFAQVLYPKTNQAAKFIYPHLMLLLNFKSGSHLPEELHCWNDASTHSALPYHMKSLPFQPASHIQQLNWLKWCWFALEPHDKSFKKCRQFRQFGQHFWKETCFEIVFLSLLTSKAFKRRNL